MGAWKRSKNSPHGDQPLSDSAKEKLNVCMMIYKFYIFLFLYVYIQTETKCCIISEFKILCTISSHYLFQLLDFCLYIHIEKKKNIKLVNHHRDIQFSFRRIGQGWGLCRLFSFFFMLHNMVKRDPAISWFRANSISRFSSKQNVPFFGKSQI